MFSLTLQTQSAAGGFGFNGSMGFKLKENLFVKTRTVLLFLLWKHIFNGELLIMSVLF